MNAYQLSCGHWVCEMALLSIGTPYACSPCDTMHTTIIGYAMAPQ